MGTRCELRFWVAVRQAGVRLAPLCLAGSSRGDWSLSPPGVPAMAEADGPLQLLEVCEQRLSRFLYDAEHKRLAWLREVEEQGLRMLDSNFGAEPELMSKTPSQRRRPRKRQSSCLKEEGKEPGRRRSSRRRSSTKLVLAKPSSQRRLSKLPALSPGAQEPSPSCRGGPRAGPGAECPQLPGTWPPGAPAPAGEAPEASPAAATSAARGAQSPGGAGASPPRAPGAAGAALLPGDQPRDPHSRAAPARAEPGRRSGQRWSRRSSLAGKCPGGSRSSSGRRSLGRDGSRTAAARETSPGGASSFGPCHLDVLLGPALLQEALLGHRVQVVAGTEPGKGGLARPSEEAAVSLGFSPGSFAKLSSEPQQGKQEPPLCAKPQEKPTHIWPRSCRQAVGALWSRPRAPDEEQRSSAAQPPASPSPAGKVVRPLKSLLQAVQRSQLLASPGGQPGGITGFIRRKTPGRAALKERERQRLESLRRKQEAEEQRRKKVEEEKRRRQAEMKQKREERLRKALQAKERVEQMEEEKKRRMEQKMLQSDEKVRPSQPRDERLAEERSRRKLCRKLEEAEARKQRALRREEHELEQQEALQREDEVKGKRVWELRSLMEQRQLEHMKERDHKQRWREKAPPGQLEPGGLTEKSRKEEESPKVLQQRHKQAEPAAVAAEPWLRAAEQEDALQEPQQLGEEKRVREAEALPAACATWLSKAVKRSVSASCLESLRGDANNYGMDLNSDDSTDDENDPRKPVPAWAEGSRLNQAVVHQYYHPVDVDQIFGLILSPRLEDIFGKSKPRYFKRTSSAVWTSPPGAQPPCGCKP
ncbi:inner centromere protein-like [Dryobates pubescens]|uniref:inner centromere protein-like n=1 Tax=Dryobates pubescens TaxID=118200 RepID=UPI0023B9A9A5|nr:inner centromere protein-like [Dryobates pubescens]